MIGASGLRVVGYYGYDGDATEVYLCNACADSVCDASIHEALGMKVEYVGSVNGYEGIEIKPVIAYTWDCEHARPGDPHVCEACYELIDPDMVECIRYREEMYGLDRCRCEDCLEIDQEAE